jgi:hypothetical protein
VWSHFKGSDWLASCRCHDRWRNPRVHCEATVIQHNRSVHDHGALQNRLSLSDWNKCKARARRNQFCHAHKHPEPWVGPVFDNHIVRRQW